MNNLIKSFTLASLVMVGQSCASDSSSDQFSHRGIRTGQKTTSHQIEGVFKQVGPEERVNIKANGERTHIQGTGNGTYQRTTSQGHKEQGFDTGLWLHHFKNASTGK